MATIMDCGKATTHRCPICSTWMDMGLYSSNLSVKGISVTLKDMPLLNCSKCNELHVTDHGKDIVTYFVQQAIQSKNTAVEVTPTGVKEKRFPFGKLDFAYSALDHDFIPGLARPSRDGFLTPVFFNLAVLNKYSQDPTYRLDLFSNTYGSIIKGEEINIQFGINRAGKVMMWLGDIAELPENEQFYLRSENVQSDHDVCSEFYDGQIGCVFSQPSIENAVLRARSALNESCQIKFGADFYQLHGEITKVIEHLRRPLFWDEQHVAPTAESFNRILVESLNVSELRNQLSPHFRKEELTGLKGLKLQELWIGKVLGMSDAGRISLPFFVLYDFRVLTCHLASDETWDRSLASINRRLGLDEDNVKLDAIYHTLLPLLTLSLNELVASVS
jgi:hypothetical protein